MKVVIIMASSSDKEWADKIQEALDLWGLASTLHLASAHKVPEKVFEIVQSYNREKEVIYITIAGRSNGLSGVVAANSVHPVIACPPFKDKDDLMVNIMSTLQMPSDTPVLTVLEPVNAAGACARIFGLLNDDMQELVQEKIDEVKESFEK